MATWVRWFLPALTLLVLVSCAAWQDRYLGEVVNRVTQDEVAKKLGPPHRTMELSAGESVSTYEYRSVKVVGGAGSVVGTSDCKTYVLTFDQNKVLREWQRRDC